MKPLLVFTNVPDVAAAERLAHVLIEARAAACVNILAACQSVYRWQGAVDVANETPLLIKTTVGAYPRVEQILRECHPYDLPEIIAVPIEHGLPGYLAWVAAETEI
ncbi:MAG: divalent-cation tolerance protein CutA [Thiobacillaceae bacterium]